MDPSNASTPLQEESKTPRGYHVESQSLAFEIDFERQILKGHTDILVQPHSNTLETFRLNCRQCQVTKATVEGKSARWKYKDPYQAVTPKAQSSIKQHHILKAKVDTYLSGDHDEELSITRPSRLTLKESEQYRAVKLEASNATSPTLDTADATGRFVPWTISIDFETDGLRDGLHWVGCTGGDDRWPHVYTRNSTFHGTASALFPCIDDPKSRHPWTLSLKYPSTLGDAFQRGAATEPSAGTVQSSSKDGQLASLTNTSDIDDYVVLSESDKDLELATICSGESTGETTGANDSNTKTSSFSIPSSVSASQLGFAIGPFEDVDLSEFRELDDDEKLGEAAIRVHGHCLPGRAQEIRNTCMPLAKAIDFFTTQFTTYTGESFKLCFVDDLVQDTAETAGLSICSTRLLFPDEIIDLLPKVTKTLVHSLATQWAGIHLVAKEAQDSWVIAGISSFMRDIFLKYLSGNNEYRYQQKLVSDEVYELDVHRPSLYDLGLALDVDPEEGRFMSLKAGVVFFILDRRLVKASGSSGMSRIVGRILNNAKADDLDASYLSTQQFLSLCNKMGHVKLDSFFQQWVYGAGCPKFEVTQDMNKKKLMILMTINQTHIQRNNARKDINPNDFIRLLKEDVRVVYAGEAPQAYQGSMTIRIHESDGTPYEHVVDLNRDSMTIEIPYNTKYKRMRRGRRQKDRFQASGADDTQDDVLLYSLGDILQTNEDVAEWKLHDWALEMETQMSDESFEWIRMDADFEWICKMEINMQSYMWISQLQQDRDVVAQMDSLQWLNYESDKKPHPLLSTFLIRTLLDRRYFYGIRTMAAKNLPNCVGGEARNIGLFHLQKAFEEFYCLPDSRMPRPNEFSDRIGYIVQCAILEGLATIRDGSGRAPMQVKRFFMDKLKFNDNSNNEYSDSYYVSTLLECLTRSLLGPRRPKDEDEDLEELVLRKDAIAEIERYRRINEWSPSFQNIFTTTALDCLVELGKSGALDLKLHDFIRYTRSDNSDQVRLRAFDCLVELDSHKDPRVMAYVINEMATDPSPHVRDNIYRIFGKGLGRMAIGEGQKEEAAPVSDGLVIEQESNNVGAQAQAQDDRRQTMDGALAALKAEIGSSKALQESMWAAIRSPILSMREVSNLLDICSVLFDTEDTLRVTLKLPRFWRCQHEGEGKLSFKQSGSFRTKPYVPIEWPKFKSAPTPASSSRPIPAPPSRRASSVASQAPALFKFTNGSSTSAPTPDPQKPTKLLKIKMPIKQDIVASPSAMSPPALSSTTPAVNGNADRSPSSGITPAAPFGFGRLNAFPAASRSPSVSAAPPLTQPSHGAITSNNNTRPSSSHSSASNTSTKKRKSATPAPRAEHLAPSASKSNSRAPSPAKANDSANGNIHANGNNTATGSNTATANDSTNGKTSINGSRHASPAKKRKSETPQPDAVEPPVKKPMLKLNFGGKAS